jgi:Trypsin/PKD domain
MKRALAVTFLLVCALAPTAVARDPESRIINGTPATEGEYPAQGYLEIDVGGGGVAACGGTVVSPTKFLTAAHCVIDENFEPRSPSVFIVGLGDVTVGPDMDQHFISSVAVHPDYAEDAGGNTNDVAMLTFDAGVTETPMRVIRPSETALWEPGDIATIIGWGVTESGASSDELLEADAPIRSDADCASAYPIAFVSSTMVCAGLADGSAASTDTCQGDSGGPLLVGSPFALTGVVSFGNGCNQAGFPGIYSRVGDQPLNGWVRGQIQGVDFELQTTTPRAGEPVPFAAIAPASGDFSWDFDDNGTFDATGPSPSHVYALPGAYEAVLRITDPEGEAAEQRREFTVGPGVPPPPPPPPPVTTPPVVAPVLRPATILVSGGRARVRRGKFKVRINFAPSAPTGTATVEAFRGKRKIGSGKTGVRPGGSRQVTIKLTKRGRRLLSRAKSKRLRVKVQVRVGRRVLASRNLTIRR